MARPMQLMHLQEELLASVLDDPAHRELYAPHSNRLHQDLPVSISRSFVQCYLNMDTGDQSEVRKGLGLWLKDPHSEALKIETFHVRPDLHWVRFGPSIIAVLRADMGDPFWVTLLTQTSQPMRVANGLTISPEALARLRKYVDSDEHWQPARGPK